MALRSSAGEFRSWQFLSFDDVARQPIDIESAVPEDLDPMMTIPDHAVRRRLSVGMWCASVAPPVLPASGWASATLSTSKVESSPRIVEV